MIRQFIKGRVYVFVDAVKERNKRVLVMSTKGHVSKELLDHAKHINLKKLKDFVSYAT